MTVQLSSLRVSAELDASKYVAGMTQKVAADKAGAASGREVGQVASETQTKLSTAANGLERLMRQTVEGYNASQRFEQGLRTLQRALDTGNVTVERAEQVLIGLHRRYGLVANAEQLAANGQTELAAAVTQANAALAAQESQLHDTTNAMKHASAANDNWRRQSLRFQMMDIGQGIPLLFQSPVHGLLNMANQGAQIAQLYGPDEGGAARGFKEAAAMAGTLVARLGPLAAVATAGAVAVAGLQQEIQASSGVAVSFGDVFMGVLQSIGDGIYSILQPAIAAISPWFSAAWDAVVAGVKWAGNAFVGGWVATFRIVNAAVGALPAAFVLAGEAAANGFLRAIEWMVQKTAEGVQSIINSINGLANTVGMTGIPDLLSPDDKPFSIGRVDLGGQAARDRLAREYQNALSGAGDAFSTDYMGDWYDAIERNAVGNYRDRQKPLKGGRSARDRESNLEREIRRIQEATAATLEEARVMDLSTYARERQAAVQELLSAAQRDGATVGKAFANAQDLINASSQQLTPALAAERERILSVADAWAKAQAAAEQAEQAREVRQFWRDTTRGMIDDLRGGLEQGKTFWEAFADAALNALDRITDKLLNDVLDALFQVNGAGSGGGGGLLSLFGGLFGGGKNIFPAAPGAGNLLWASGGYTGRGGKFEPAGVVHRGEYVFSSEATGRLGVAYLEKLHRSARGYAEGGYVGERAGFGWSPAANVNYPSAANGNTKVEVEVFVRDDGKFDARVRNVSREEAGRSLATYRASDTMTEDVAGHFKRGQGDRLIRG